MNSKVQKNKKINDKKQTYKYIIADSIVLNFKDEYRLSKKEYMLLYSFFVTYSMCGTQSGKKRSFVDYGWENTNLTENKKLNSKLHKIIDLNTENFVFTEEDNLKEKFEKCGLTDGKLLDYRTERAVIAKTSGTNKYLKLFYRIRDGLAHGRFYLKMVQDEKMIIIQDDNSDNVTARIVIKLETLLDIIQTIDRKKILISRDVRYTIKKKKLLHV